MTTEEMQETVDKISKDNRDLGDMTKATLGRATGYGLETLREWHEQLLAKVDEAIAECDRQIRRRKAKPNTRWQAGHSLP